MTTDNIGTRVFKKTSQNGMITVYLGKRDFVDHLTHVDEIDGVVLIDVNYLRNRKVYGHILAAFRYGREDLDVLGFNFRKDLYLASKCIYPSHEKYQVTRLQERLMKKLGDQAFPFFFQLPTNCPASVTLQPAPGDTGKPCGVDYELRIYVGENLDSKPEKRNSVKLAIRKVTYAPSCQGVQPFVEISKDFVMSPNKLHLEASLDKELYHHGEEIAVNVHVDNNSNRTVKKVKVSIKQFAEICIFSTAQYRCTVAELESEDGCPVSPGFKLSKVYYLKPLLANNKSKKGLALDGQLKQEDSNLASSTISKGQKENLGIIVKYKVKVKLCLGPLGGDLVAELPFTLMHPKPNDLDENNHINGNVNRNNHLNVIQSNALMNLKNNIHENSNSITNSKIKTKNNQKKNDSNDHNLIQLDTDSSEDDIIFEDFARLRLRGESN